MLTEEKNIKNVKCDGDDLFIKVDGIVYATIHAVPKNKSSECYVVHNDCYHVLKNKYGKITFNDLNDSKIVGLFKKYHGQFFYSCLAYLEDPSLLESPLKNKNTMEKLLNMLKNCCPKMLNNMLKNIKPLKKDRPSPSESATLFNVGTKKMMEIFG
jgi:hypothetical protein